MSLESLPDVCVFRIFDHLPLIDLLTQIPQVCQRWRSLQPVALLRRRSLSLFVGPDPLHLIHRSSFVMPFSIDPETSQLIPYHHNDLSRLVYDELNSQQIEKITKTLPNVAILEIAQRDIHFGAIYDIVRIIDFYSTKLVTLKLWISYCDEDVTTQRAISDHLESLVNCINRLPSLTHLTFYCRHQLILPGYHQANLDLPIFGQLSHLQWFTFDSADELRQSLLEYGEPNQRLTQIELQNLINNHSLERLLLLEPQFAQRFTNLDISFSSIELNQLQSFCTLFNQLASLYIYVENISIAQYAKCLANLPQLVHLRMDINFEYYRPPPIRQLETVPQLTAILFLSMRVISTSHSDLALLCPEWVFPSLQVVQIVNLNEQCFDEPCDYVYPDITTEQRKECTKQLLQPFRKCTKLKKACALKGFVSDDQLEWSIDEL